MKPIIKDIFNEFTFGNILNSKLIKSISNSSLTADSQHLMESRALDSMELHRPPKEALRELVGKFKEYPEEIGDHPDFSYLSGDEHEFHYIVSVFIDIKGSTILGIKLPLEEVKYIKNGILITAIDIFQAFNGHIHRLQGDAIFGMFGRRGISKSDAIIDALNATSFVQYYFKNYLSNEFESLGWPAIKIRAGIDFGDDDKVMWSSYGIKNCSEVTTTSIHTDLAAKLQSKASGMGTMIGDNIREYLDFPDEFYSVKTSTRDGNEIKLPYIINNNYLTYRMWNFEWEKYINRFLFIDRASKYAYKCQSFFKFRCFYSINGNSYDNEYMANCGALPKKANLKFTLDIPKVLKYDEIEWHVNNRGEEAMNAGVLNYEMEGYKNKIYCLQSTAYRGHHYMKCTIKNQNRIVAQEYFGIYVGD